MYKKLLDNDAFVRKNLEKLVKKYSRQNIIISNGEIFTGDNAVKEARKKYHNVTPMFFPVPGEDEFNHLL